MDYKNVNRKVYDRHARRFAEDTKNYLKEHIQAEAESFIANLPGKDILDLGSGPGRDSAFFRERGLNPLCFDLSREMVKLCEKKGLPAIVGDLENMPFEDNSFDGVWAYTSLLHMPKANLPIVLGRINKILSSKGIFYMGMKEGIFEGWIDSDRFRGERRFFSLYENEELRSLLLEQFEVMHHSKIPLGKAVFLNYLCRKK